MPEKFLARGAEALIVTNKNKVIKRRVKKSYRLEKLDERLRRQRTRTESRLLERASKLIPTTNTVNVNESKKEMKIIKKFWEKVHKEQGKILLVGSGIVNRILLSFALKIDPQKAHFMQHPTGLTRIERVEERKRYRVWHMNDTSHLSDKLMIMQK